MAMMSLPPGFRFHPTDVELVKYYLKRKSLGKKLRFEAIAEINIYNYSPWDLPDKSYLQNRDLEWFFFCPILRKNASGARFVRATETGYWKVTGKDRPVMHSDQTVGMVKTLVFHQGHAPKGERTDWVMHEYRIMEKELADAGVDQAAYVLVKVFKKSGPGPKIGAQYGAPFNEEEWDVDDDEIQNCAETLQPSATLPPSAVANNSLSVVTSTFISGSTSSAPDNSPLSAIAHNSRYSVDTATQSATPLAHSNCNSIGTSSFVVPSEPLFSLTHNSDSAITATQSATPLAHSNCNSIGTSSFVLPSKPLFSLTHNSDSAITGTFFEGGTLPVPGGPSTVISSGNDVTLPAGEVDVESLLSMFTEDDFTSLPSDLNDDNQINGEEFIELDDIFADLDDLGDWEQLKRLP